jgi:hypothetical protein
VCSRAEVTTRSTIAVTDRHATRNNSETADPDMRAASQAHVSSNANVNRLPARAHGTPATAIPWARQRTLGASASR